MIEALYLPLVLVAGVIGVAVGAFAWRYRGQPGSRALAAFATAASLWTVAEGLSVARSGLETSQFWAQVALSFSVVVPVAWLLLVLGYTGTERLLTRGLFAALLVEPAAFVALVWTEGRHGLVWRDGESIPVGEFDAFAGEFGLAFWGHQAYSYLLVTAGVVLLARVLVRSNRLFRWQSTAWLSAIAVPALTSALSVFGLFPRGLDPTGLSYVLASVLLAAALFDTQLRSVAPATREIGREALLSDLEDAIIILDGDDGIVDANAAAEEMLGGGAESYLGQDLADVRPALASALATTDDRAELDLDVGRRVRHYDVRVSSLHRGYGTLSGRVVSLRDVTERQQREQRLDVLNRLLRHNIRNELNLVRGQIELARPSVTDEESNERLETAIEAVDGIVTRSDKVGRLSRLLETETGGSIDIAAELRGEFRTGEPAGHDGEILVSLPETLRVAGGRSLVAAFDELVGNGLVHNDGAEPRVTLSLDQEQTDAEHVGITISDNGPGIDEQEYRTVVEGEETPLRHSSGVGLWLATWIVRRAGGTLSFENTDDGCTVSVRLPRPEETAVA